MSVKFLVIRFSSIGDIVLTTPLVRCLKHQVDDAEVHYVTKEQYAGLVTTNPYIDKVHLLKNNLGELLKSLSEEQFDYIIDLHHNIRSRRIKSALKAISFSFDKLNIAKYLLVNFKINRLPQRHIVDRYLDTLQLFEVVNDGEGLDYFIPENEGQYKDLLPTEFNQGFIAFVVAGTWATKRLPAEKVAAICNRIKFPVVILGGKDENTEGEAVFLRSKGNVLNLCGKIDLNQSASLVRDAKLVLTNDTGLMHIAAAFKKKILTFWGNTVPAFGMVPYLADPDSLPMEVETLSCRPCSKLGYRKCPRKHFRCMEEQNIDIAVHWINEHFNR